MRPRAFFLIGFSLILAAGEPAADPNAPSPLDQKMVAPDLRPETALDRIRKRNLFHPTRGVLPAGADGTGGSALHLPSLVGTLVTPKHHSALLRWEEGGIAQIVEVGDKVEGYKVAQIAQNRVQLMGLVDGAAHWVELEPSTPLGPSAEGSKGDVDSLLELTKKRPAPAQPTPPPAVPTPRSRP